MTFGGCGLRSAPPAPPLSFSRPCVGAHRVTFTPGRSSRCSGIACRGDLRLLLLSAHLPALTVRHRLSAALPLAPFRPLAGSSRLPSRAPRCSRLLGWRPFSAAARFVAFRARARRAVRARRCAFPPRARLTCRRSSLRRLAWVSPWISLPGAFLLTPPLALHGSAFTMRCGRSSPPSRSLICSSTSPSSYSSAGTITPRPRPSPPHG